MPINDKRNVISCELCGETGGELLWRNDFCRVVLVNDVEYPGFCRVIVNRHAKEMTDLSVSERNSLMSVVFSVEQAIINVLQPKKINLASLGNVIPHIHWHIIPRFADDKHFPNSIWGTVEREGIKRVADIAALCKAIDAALGSPS
jgi:diadenosine tetraphosphate (Ap4A) HIT family hydrolase